jgi:anti-sigma regulatory factor (Ser/Thr protein kinase)
MNDRRTFPPDAESVAAARRFVLHHVPADDRVIREQIAVLVSELATNAVSHGRASFVVDVAVDDTQIVVEVTDDGAGLPNLRDTEATSTSGRGLHIVDCFATSWGVRVNATDKTVWFALSLRPGGADSLDHRRRGASSAGNTEVESDTPSSLAPARRNRTPRASSCTRRRVHSSTRAADGRCRRSM